MAEEVRAEVLEELQAQIGGGLRALADRVVDNMTALRTCLP
jgi:hypothetical protein